jgi:hypothetical protein
MDQLDDEKPFLTRASFIEAIASLVAMYPDEVCRIVQGSNKALFKVLYAATAETRIEWYLNNTRVRHLLPTSMLSLLSSGTSSNEAFHRELNNWFRGHVKMHQATLAQKLEVLHFTKLLTHDRALNFPVHRQLRQGEILARSCILHLWSDEAWISWCRCLVSDEASIRSKAHLPLADERASQKTRVREWVAKRPAAAVKPQRKRTVFTRKRTLQLCLVHKKPSKK